MVEKVKKDIIKSVIACAEGDEGGKLAGYTAFATQMLMAAPVEFLQEHVPGVLYHATLAQFKFIRTRKGDEPRKVRVYNPDEKQDGWESERTIVETCATDSPFIFDSVMAEVQQRGFKVYEVMHPIYRLARDKKGVIIDVRDSLKDKQGEEGYGKESIMHLQITHIASDDMRAELEQELYRVLEYVSLAVVDWRTMLARTEEIVASLIRLEALKPLPYKSADIEEVRDFLRWAVDDNFLFLGICEYDFVRKKGEIEVRVQEGSQLGIFRAENDAHKPVGMTALPLSSFDEDNPQLLEITKSTRRSIVHRPAHMDYLSIKIYNEDGQITGEHRILGLFTSSAYYQSARLIPITRRKISRVVERSGYSEDGHNGKALVTVLEGYPRDELLQISEEDLYSHAMGVVELTDRPRTKLFVRHDKFSRFVSCIVYIPRDRYNTQLRQKVQHTLEEAFGGSMTDYYTQVTESPLARVHVLINADLGCKIIHANERMVEKQLISITNNWANGLRDRLITSLGERQGEQLYFDYVNAFLESFKDSYHFGGTLCDIIKMEEAYSTEGLALDLYQLEADNEFSYQLKLYHPGTQVTLSDVLPILENMGFHAIDELTFLITPSHKAEGIWVHHFRLNVSRKSLFESLKNNNEDYQSGSILTRIKQEFEEALYLVWHKKLDDDPLNKLILRANMSWRDVTLLRAYSRYMLQASFPYSHDYIASTVARHPSICRSLMEFFYTKFDPSYSSDSRGDVCAKIELRIIDELSKIESVAEDKIIRRMFDLMKAALRTNFFQHSSAAANENRDIHCGDDSNETYFNSKTGSEVQGVKSTGEASDYCTLQSDKYMAFFGKFGLIKPLCLTLQEKDIYKEHISFKFDPTQIPNLPLPHPYAEIFVYSSYMEGVHLRGGKVARGGLRWSDRHEDYRTEVLGLVKAQMVKNSVIVPVGSKGGFVVKKPAQTREEFMTQGVECYKTYLRGLLDVTDNIVDGDVITPDNVVRYDEDDPYLVVAADKGTATFSDIANEISASYNFWLADAFASGGSHGYDHKKMGITARGAWVSVQRHFMEMGVDIQKEEFTVTGIGDMSGDVFGNGMLLSKCIRLVAAFNHLHIFIDPEPDTAKSYKERKRLFDMPRSSWADYDAKLISAGGGVFERKAKSIKLTKQIKQRFNIDESELSPEALIRAILCADVDLLWNGGIGTYFKAETESNEGVGDKANDGLRINGHELNCKVVGEGGNLGATQRGRIEYALKGHGGQGGRINTDAIDNSAGVDCSDHEVNIKIALGIAVDSGRITEDERNELLAQMTDEVAELVLNDNKFQTVAITIAEQQGTMALERQNRLMQMLEDKNKLDRKLEFLPSEEVLANRQLRNIGLTRPELSVIMAYSKNDIYDELIASNMPDEEYFEVDLLRYFPAVMQEEYREEILQHPLRREIIATSVSNSIVNRLGTSFYLRMKEDTGMQGCDVARAYAIARDSFNMREIWAQIESLSGKNIKPKEGGKAIALVQTELYLETRKAVERVTRWFLRNLPQPIRISNNISEYRAGIIEIEENLDNIISSIIASARDERFAYYKALGVDKELAHKVACLEAMSSACDIVNVAQKTGMSVTFVGKIYHEIGMRLGIGWLRYSASRLVSPSHWENLAVQTLVESLLDHQMRLTVEAVKCAGNADKSKVEAAKIMSVWTKKQAKTLERYDSFIRDLKKQKEVTAAMITVILRRLDALYQTDEV